MERHGGNNRGVLLLIISLSKWKDERPDECGVLQVSFRDGVLSGTMTAGADLATIQPVHSNVQH